MTYIHQFHSTYTKRMAFPALLLTLTFGLAACSSATEEVEQAAETAEENITAATNVPAGWSFRGDGGTGENSMMMAMAGNTYHCVMGGPPTDTGIFYNPEWTSTGDHTFSATMTENMKATHPTSYGLIFGGTNLDATDQMYSYFLVRQNGEFYIANRDGADVSAVVPWTANDAINKEADDGTQTNTLSVQISGDNVIFSVNGTEVQTVPAAELHTNGEYGFRIGHALDVTITDVTM